MDLNEIHSRLEDAVDRLQNIENPKEFAKSNPREWFGLIQQVVQNYNFIQTHAEPNDFFMIDSITTVMEMGLENPKLKSLSNYIVNSKKHATQNVQTSKEETVTNKDTNRMDPHELMNKIDSIVFEIRGNNGYDTNTIDEYQNLLEAYKSQLTAQQSDYSPQVYTSLMDSLNIELQKIEKFCALLQSETMQDFTI